MTLVPPRRKLASYLTRYCCRDLVTNLDRGRSLMRIKIIVGDARFMPCLE